MTAPRFPCGTLRLRPTTPDPPSQPAAPPPPDPAEIAARKAANIQREREA